MKNETKKETKLYEITARLDVEIHEEIFAVSEEDAKKQMREYFHNRMIFDEPSESFAKYLVDENILIYFSLFFSLYNKKGRKQKERIVYYVKL